MDARGTEGERFTGDESNSPSNPFAIGAIVPNPFNPKTAISFSLPRSARVDLSIYSAQGRVVKRLARDVLPPGRHQMAWWGRDDRGRKVAAGVYVCRLAVGKHRDVLRVALVK